MLLPGAIIGAGFAPFSGIILDKMGARKPILIGATLIVLAQLFLSIGHDITKGNAKPRHENHVKDEDQRIGKRETKQAK